MSRSSSNSGDNANDELANAEDEHSEEEECEKWEELAEVERALFTAIKRNSAACVQHALQNGANVNRNSSDIYFGSPLFDACNRGYDEVVRILLDAGADIRWRNKNDRSSLSMACASGHLSIVEMLLHHDNDLLEIANNNGETPLMVAIDHGRTGIVHFLLDRGANALMTTTQFGMTTLMVACDNWSALEIVRRLLAAGVALEARDEMDRTALHHVAANGTIEVMRALIVDHNANVLALEENGKTPFDLVPRYRFADAGRRAFLIECYSNKMTQEQDRLALHAVLGAAEYSFSEDDEFQPPLNPLRIRLTLGKLTLQHFHTLLSSLDAEMVRNRDESGMLPVHIACQSNAPVEVLSMLVEMDPATLQIADNTGALPIHSLCGSGTPADYASVQYLVEQGGVGTLDARNRNGALPLHVLCESNNPTLRTIQYLIQSVPTSVTVQTNAGHYPFMIAACSSSAASLSVVYALVRANPSVL